MAKFKVNKTSNYTVMSNYHLKDKNLSLKAKGLLSVMLSLKDDWNYSINGLVAICKENETAVKSALNELKKYSYLKINKSKNQYGKFEYIYNIYEEPEVENPGVENPPLEKPAVENQVQLNTKQLNTKELNTNNKNKKERKSFDEIINNYTNNFNLINELKKYIQALFINKKKITNYSLELALNELDKLSTEDDEKIEIIRNAIRSGYVKFYPISKNVQRNTTEETTADRVKRAIGGV